MNNQQLPDITTDFSGWYNAVIAKAEIVDQSPTRGCVVIRPYGYRIWEFIRAELDKRIKNIGIDNAYFPLLIPESFLQKEADHIEGFSPELAVVTHAGGKKLEEPYVIRPTSETIIYHMFERWIKSHRDLPLKINQWANVVRWEMRSRPFLRTTEFLWQEGHTAHETREEALRLALEIREMYVSVIRDLLAVPVITGRKTDKERFAGADSTFTMEAMMPDGKALQMGTSHLLNQSFPASFDVKFQGKDGKMETPWCTSWGVTTRLLGALIMVHGDQKGLVMPPLVAPHQVVIIPIWRTSQEKEAVDAVIAKAKSFFSKIGIRFFVDDRDERPGAKFFKWETKGVPLRIEIGPRNIQQGTVTIISRLLENGEQPKLEMPQEEGFVHVGKFLREIHDHMLMRATKKRDSLIFHGEKLSDYGDKLEEKAGFYVSPWCGSRECEDKLVDYKASIRCILEDRKPDYPECFVCNNVAQHAVIVAKSY